MSDEREDPPAAADADEAARQAQDIRDRVDQDLRALEARMPDPDTLQARVKAIGGAVGSVIAVLAAIGVIVKRRSAKASEEKAVRRQAEALAAALPDAALHVRHEQVTVSGKAGRIGLLISLVALGVAAWSRFSPDRGDTDPEPDIWGPA